MITSTASAAHPFPQRPPMREKYRPTRRFDALNVERDRRLVVGEERLDVQLERAVVERLAVDLGQELESAERADLCRDRVGVRGEAVRPHRLAEVGERVDVALL